MESKVTELRKFGLTLGSAFLLIAGYTAARNRLVPELVAVGITLLIFMLLYPKALAPVKWFWDKVGLILGTINTYVILFVVYFLIITPIGLMMRLLGKDALKLKPQKPGASYWEPASTANDHSMERQF